MPKSIYSEITLPEIVRKANVLADQLNFPLLPEGRLAEYQGPPSACIPQVGRLLKVLASGKPGGRIGEQGTGAGVGTAWLASGLCGGAHLISVEIDPLRASEVAKLFVNDPNIEIRMGDWHDVMSPSEPYDLLFMDAMPRQDLVPSKWDSVVELVKIGGQIIMDDLIPVELWPPDWDEIVDGKREFAFANPRVVGTEVRTTSKTSALIVTRVQ